MRRLLLPLLLLIGSTVFCQYDSTKMTRVRAAFAFHTGIGYCTAFFADVGMAHAKVETVGYHPFEAAAYLSSEFYLDKTFIIAPKLGFWFSGGVAGIGCGANLLYYTNFNNGVFVFRPEVGFGVGGFKIYYGKNIKGEKKYDIQQLGEGLVGLNIWFGKTVRYRTTNQ